MGPLPHRSPTGSARQSLRSPDAGLGYRHTILRLRYRAGVDSYLDVFTAQTSLLTQQQTTLNLRVEQMTSNVQLIEVLGGGGDNVQLPSERRLLRNKIPNR